MTAKLEEVVVKPDWRDHQKLGPHRRQRHFELCDRSAIGLRRGWTRVGLRLDRILLWRGSARGGCPPRRCRLRLRPGRFDNHLRVIRGQRLAEGPDALRRAQPDFQLARLGLAGSGSQRVYRHSDFAPIVPIDRDDRPLRSAPIADGVSVKIGVGGAVIHLTNATPDRAGRREQCNKIKLALGENLLEHG